MPIPSLNIPVPTMEQSAPWMSGMSQANELIRQQLVMQQMRQQNKYLQPMLEQQLLAASLQNKVLQPQAEMAGDLAKADLAAKLSQALQSRASAGYYGVETEKMQQMMPYDILKARLGVYTDPMLSRLAQIEEARKSGSISPQTFSDVGFGQAKEDMKSGSYAIPQDKLSQFAENVKRVGGTAAPGSYDLTGASTMPETFPQSAQEDDKYRNWLLTGSMISPMQKMQMEAEGKGMEQSAKDRATSYQKLLDTYTMQQESAGTALTNLDEWKENYDKSFAKGPIKGKYMTLVDPDAQVAIKDAYNLMMGELKPMFGGLGQIRVKEIEMLAKGSPNQELLPRAAQRIYEEVKAALMIQQKKGELAMQVRQYTNDPNVLQYVISSASKNSNPISGGKIDLSKLDDWDKYASKEAVQKAMYGKSYIPEGVKRDIPMSEVAKATTSGSNELVSVISPDGVRGTIPADKISQGIAKGYKVIR